MKQPRVRPCTAMVAGLVLCGCKASGPENATGNTDGTSSTSGTSVSTTASEGTSSASTATGGGSAGTDPTGTSGPGPGVRFDVPDGTGDPPPGEGCKGVDILFAIDPSPSMFDEQERLAAAFPQFMQTIDTELVQQKGIDYHVGVLAAEMGGADYCLWGNTCTPGYRGRLLHEVGRLDCAADLPPGRWIEPGPVDDVAAQFRCIASFGDYYTVQEMPLETLRAAMIDRVDDAESYNGGFLRDDALLVLVILTDEDDQSDWMVPPVYDPSPRGPWAPVQD